MTRGKTSVDLCNTCHKNPAAGKSHVHGPVLAGYCESCHSAHTSQFPKMLNSQGSALCLDCHKDMQRQMKEVRFKHKAVEGNCMDCHDPHATNHTRQLTEEPLQLCSKCHQNETKMATEAKYKHSVVVKDQACLNCHTAHGELPKTATGKIQRFRLRS